MQRDGDRVLDRQVQEPDVPGLSFDEGADPGAVVRADEQVSFAMASEVVAVARAGRRALRARRHPC